MVLIRLDGWTPLQGFDCRGSGAAGCYVCHCRESSATLPEVLEPRETAWLRFLALRLAIRGRRAPPASGRSLDGTGYGSAKMARKSSQKPMDRPLGVPPQHTARTGRGRAVRGVRGRCCVQLNHSQSFLTGSDLGPGLPAPVGVN